MDASIGPIVHSTQRERDRLNSSYSFGRLHFIMHVFVDTNVLLSFYHFTKDDLDSLHEVFVSHQCQTVTMHVTDQVRDEFLRNRESKVLDALKRFRAVSVSLESPAFMQSYPQFSQLEKASKAFRKHHKKLLDAVMPDIITKKLPADLLINNMFDESELVETTKGAFALAKRRVGVGNPPGKGSSLGDAINWEMLLDNVPEKQDLYIISNDGDFYSEIESHRANPFLLDEWKRRKKSTLHCYRALSDFLKDHFDGVTLSLDPEKAAAIDALARSGSFAYTHQLVTELAAFSFFSLTETRAILDAAVSNSQFGGIVGDSDVRQLFLRAINPHRSKLTDSEHKKMIARVDDHDG